jgi:hypothetical protein
MRILLLNQCFYPDVVSTAQHASDLASELARRGHEVTVVASRRAYNDASTTFPKEEVWHGCRISRVPCLALGKTAKWRRVMNFGSFFVSCALRLLFLGRFDVVIGLTTPPLISSLAALFVRLTGGRFVFWVMDLNPDEAVAAGWLDERSAAAAVLKSLLSASLRASEGIVVLDRFMRDRVIAKGVSAEKVWVIPPWSHSDVVEFDESARHAFRRTYNLADKYVVMYSGNHTPCHPLDTILESARLAREYTNLVFCFVGGGSEYPKVVEFARKHNLDNILCLPYQPLARLSASLSAADMHFVVMGDPFVGIVHTCKIYNVMRVGAPVLYIGPADSHVGDIASTCTGAPMFHVRHGDAGQVLQTILSGARYSVPDAAIRVAGDRFCQEALVSKFADLVEALHGLAPAIGVDDFSPVPEKKSRSLAASAQAGHW